MGQTGTGPAWPAPPTPSGPLHRTRIGATAWLIALAHGSTPRRKAMDQIAAEQIFDRREAGLEAEREPLIMRAELDETEHERVRECDASPKAIHQE